MKHISDVIVITFKRNRWDPRIGELKKVINKLESKRWEMIEAGIRLGFSHTVTVKLSQLVDELHNEHIRIESEKRNKREEKINYNKLS
jgi:hypothetical protein